MYTKSANELFIYNLNYLSMHASVHICVIIFIAMFLCAHYRDNM